MQPIETITSGIYKLEIFHDDSPESPWEWESATSMRFITNTPRNLSSQNMERQRIDLGDFDTSRGIDSVFRQIRSILPGKGWCLYVVYAYIHSGIALSLSRGGYPFNCPWDSGIGGILCVNPIAMGWNKGSGNFKARGVAKAMIQSLNQYYSGDVYGYRVSVNLGDDENEDWDEKDSCWGFYGMDHVMDEGKSSLDHYIAKEKEATAFERSSMAL